MFTRRVKLQLSVFTALAVISIVLIGRDYLQVDKMAGIGLDEVTFEFSDASGLYPGAIVTYRGVKVGKVVRLDLAEDGTARVVAEIESDSRIPRAMSAEAHSTSAIGENYIEIRPTSDQGPFLADGDVVPADQTTGMDPAGNLLEGLTALTRSIPARDTDVVLDEVDRALGGADHDIDRLLVSSQALVDGATANVGSIERLIAETGPFLATAQAVAPEVRSSLAHLASFSGSLDDSRAAINRLLKHMPAVAGSLDDLLTDVESDIPILLNDLLSTGQILKVYNPGLEQILVVYPAVMGAVQAAAKGGAPGSIYLGARLSVNQPPNCYTGFLPIKDQRDFHDETQRPDVPDDLYCKVAHDDPRAVRGARNTPCFNVPGVRAASVEECMGRRIGTVDDPLGRVRPTSSYDPRNGRVLTSDGEYFEIGGVRPTIQSEGETWQSLFLK